LHVFIDSCMVFQGFLGIHDAHKSNCKYLDVNPYIYRTLT
jgi:serine phosphatase RsbU (regulator of sigma subunit)